MKRAAMRLGVMVMAAALTACGSPPTSDTANTSTATPTPATGTESDTASASAATSAHPAVTLAVGALTGDATRGRAVFARCAACHSVSAGQNGVGPSLHGVFGRAAGGVAGFGYSAALKASGKTWDVASLDHFIEAPSMDVAGTRMMFVLTDDQARADVIAYLSTLK